MNRLMADRIGGGLSLLLLIALTGIAWVLAELSSVRSPDASISAPDTPKAALRGVQFIQSDKAGSALYTINAVAGEQLQDGRITLTSPIFLREVQGVGLTEIRSGMGALSANHDEVWMSEGVMAQQIKTASPADRLELQTPELLVFANQERARASGAVRIAQRGRVLTGQGLELDLRTGQYRVLAQAQVEMIP
ncbi:MAG: LPS export ABC transporter periplasmic protein LptC [Burkholderiaceae bacterium]